MSEKHPRVLLAAVIESSDQLSVLLTQHGDSYWHFPDGERCGKESSFIETIRRSVEDDLGVVVGEVNLQLCTPIIKYNKDTHIITLHFAVRLCMPENFAPKAGLKFKWFAKDPAKRPRKIKLLSSTAEIISRWDVSNK